MVTEIKTHGIALVDALVEYETGVMDDVETIALFQELIDSGMAWTLQGHYGRTAMALVEQGLCTPPTGE